MRRAALAGQAAVVAFLILLAVHVVVPQSSGPLALSEVLEPYLTLVALVAAGIAVTARTRPALLVAAVFVVAIVIRNAPVWLSVPVAVPPNALRVATWNVEAGQDVASRALDPLSGLDADLLALQELQPPLVDALREANVIGGTYPEAALSPDYGVRGVGLLSRFPILESSASKEPPYLRALVALPDVAQPVAVYVVHPLPARFEKVVGMPFGLDTRERDAALALIRQQIDADLAVGRGVLLMGDLNTTEREPGYALLGRGLHDAHLEAGLGPGFAWRPDSLAALPFGLLRIDYVLAGGGLVPVASSTECHSASDHCVVRAVLDAGP